MQSTFIQRFNATVERLRAHPEIEVYEVDVRPPASERDIRQAEKSVGHTLPDDLRAFYTAHDGVFLEWGLRGRTYAARTAKYGYPDYGQPPGCINLLPVHAAMTAEWLDTSHVNEIEPEHRELLFGAAEEDEGAEDEDEDKVEVVCVDNFSKYNHADLIFGASPVVVVSTDHGADMNSSDFVSFSTYLELVLSVYGVNRYTHGIGGAWRRKPQRVDAWTRVLDLDELVAELRKD